MKDFLMTLVLIVLLSIVGAFSLHYLESKEYDCNDFKNWYEAKMKFQENSEDIYNLDLDNDGVPCNNLL